MDKAISGADFPPSFIPIGPCTDLICSSLKPVSFNLWHLLECVFLLLTQYNKFFIQCML